MTAEGPEGGGPSGPTGRLLGLLAGKWVVQAVSTAAKLGLADALAEGPRGVEDLAEALGCHAPSLGRLLGVLAGEGVVERGLDDRFGLTAVGEQLKTGALKDLAVFVGSPSQWHPWAALDHSVRSGEAAFAHVHGLSLFDYLAAHPDESRLYDDAVDAFTREQARRLAEVEDFASAARVVDVGGGRGTLIIEVLRRFEHLRGTLFDLAHVADPARERIAAAGLAGRCDVETGDFHARVPEGADVYVIKHVIHNWPDEDAAALLKRCGAAMAPGGRVMVVEGVLLPGNRRDGTRLLDLEMLVLTGGGRERTKPEFRQLFRAAGLKLVRGRPLAGGARLLVGERG